MVSTTDYTDNSDRKKILVTGVAEVHPAPPSIEASNNFIFFLNFVRKE